MWTSKFFEIMLGHMLLTSSSRKQSLCSVVFWNLLELHFQGHVFLLHDSSFSLQLPYFLHHIRGICQREMKRYKPKSGATPSLPIVFALTKRFSSVVGSWFSDNKSEVSKKYFQTKSLKILEFFSKNRKLTNTGKFNQLCEIEVSLLQETRLELNAIPVNSHRPFSGFISKIPSHFPVGPFEQT